MQHKNLTPFYWAPKTTSRQPPQVEMAVIVRGTFRLAPGQPLTPIEDKIEQGFMSGELFAPEDLNQEGELTYPGDFADWKPHADVLLKGTCYPPKGADVTCQVRFGLGGWSKALRVVGPRVYRPGVLFGGKASDPEPFTHVPLTWANAYGGEGYPENPVGRGFTGELLPAIDHPDEPVTKTGVKKVRPAGYGPISPNWIQRVRKRGKKWGKAWRAKRFPFYAEDFDWTYFNVAPPDQQLPYLRGDETLSFEHLHPEQRSWSVALPGQRVRAFVKTDDGQIREPEMVLDTVYADLDAGRLYLTWRGLSPIRELDQSDVAAVLIAAEPLGQALPAADYERQLAEFEADPIGLEGKFPPGFLEVAKAIEAAELAERDGTPPPDLKQLAANLPAGCPFPPWFLTAVAGEADPLGIKAKLPPALLAADPAAALLASKGVPEALAKQSSRDALLGKVGQAGQDPVGGIGALGELAGLLPPDKQGEFKSNMAAVAKQLAGAEAQAKDPGLLAQAAAKAKEQELLREAKELAQVEGTLRGEPPPPDKLTLTKQELKVKLAGVEDPRAAEALAKLEQAPSLDAILAKTLAPLDALELPDPPDPSGPLAQLEAASAKLVADEAKLRARGIDHPLLGLFAFGHRLIAKMPRPADVMPDLSRVLWALGDTRSKLLAQGASLAALGPLTRLMGKVEAIQAAVPKPPPPPPKDFDGQKLQGVDLRGRDLAGKSFVGADLTRADLSGSRLAGADFSRAVLAQANLSQTDLSRANFTGADLTGASLVQAYAAEARLIEADLAGADLTAVNLHGARLEQAKLGQAKLVNARLTGADLRFALLPKADLSGADLSGADLSLATLDKVRADGANLSRSKLEMVKLTKARLRGANLQGATGKLGFLTGSDLSGADLRGVDFEKMDLGQTRLEDANFQGATLRGVLMRDVQADRARFVQADVGGSSVMGASSFQRANLVGATGPRSVWMDADLRGADFSHASLRDAFFQGANAEEAVFFGAGLQRASFRKARLGRARFVRANLCGADLSHSTLLDTQFTGANCYDVKFIAAQLGPCDFLEANLRAAQFDPDHPERRT